MIDNRFYVYVLFDWQGCPRYVGKGKGNRWLWHEQTIDPNNPKKNSFIERTLLVLGDIPKIKIADNLTEPEAFATETSLIKAIGRYPRGPLVNLTDKRNGPSSERITAWHASRSPEERRASGLKSAATNVQRYSAEERSARSSKNARAQGIEVLSSRMKTIILSLPPEIRVENGKRARRSVNQDNLTASLRQFWSMLP